MIKIQIFSDTHCFGTYMPTITDADILVCVGDVDAGLNFETWIKSIIKKHKKPFIFVPGNHDFFLDKSIEEWINYYKSIQIDNFYILQNNSIQIKGYHFFGSTFWTNYHNNPNMEVAANTSGIKDFSYIYKNNKQNLSTTEIKFLNSEAVFLLEKFLKTVNMEKTIILTHFPPATFCTDKYQPKSLLDGHFCSNYDSKLFYEWKVKAWIYGHTHDFYQFNVDNTELICNPIGGFNKQNRHRNIDFKESFILTLT